ncbi:MAG TPA: DUF5060 domain-containing protein [Thermoanaerobaculia bacterium]|nr:DUF5060 domain-containing protein [Thermoanaerobaculia bacterium]
MAKRIFVFVLFVGTLAIATSRAGGAVSRFDTAEIVLRSTSSFNASAGTPNPFTAVDLTARVTAPSGRAYTVNGFFDGDGASGTTGNVFKIRVYADEIGTWRWTTTSNTAGLNGQSGTFAVSGTLAGVFAQGPVVENPAHPRTLMYQYGEPVYLIGKFLDVAASAPLQYSHTMLSEQLTETQRQAMLDRHLGMKLNKINVYLANQGDYGGVATTPWVGSAGSNDKQRFDLARWRTFERWVLKMRSSGVVAQLWFFADDSGFGDLPDADRQRLIRYGMARLSGYVNTVFTLALEWQEGWSTSEVGTSMSYLQAQNPWARLASVHGVTGDFSFATATWADYMDTQAGNEVGHAEVHAHGLRNRTFAAKPLFQEEFGLGNEDTAHRQKAWAAFTAGAAGSGTGAFLAPLATFASQVDFERMDPADALATSGNAYVLAERGSAYVLYLYNGGTVRLDLRGVSATFNARWYDPRLGTFGTAVSVAGGQERSFTAPAGGDWVLYVLKSGSGSTADPNRSLNRAEMADTVVKSIYGTGFVPPPATGLFSDVSASFWAASVIEQQFRDGLTAGCATSPLRYCPGNLLSRAEMAVVLLRIRHGRSYVPPPATGRVFGDVPITHWAVRWIEQLYVEGITSGCSASPRLYCPDRSVTAGELDIFLGGIAGTP